MFSSNPKNRNPPKASNRLQQLRQRLPRRFNSVPHRLLEEVTLAVPDEKAGNETISRSGIGTPVEIFVKGRARTNASAAVPLAEKLNWRSPRKNVELSTPSSRSQSSQKPKVSRAPFRPWSSNPASPPTRVR